MWETDGYAHAEFRCVNIWEGVFYISETERWGGGGYGLDVG